MTGDVCRRCGRVIEMMARKGTGICGSACEKAEGTPQGEVEGSEPVRSEPSCAT